MTHREIRVLDDGTRVYADYHRYVPLAPEERKNGVNKPDDPRAVRFHGQWFLPLELLPEDQRVIPPTRADSDAYDHMSKPGACKCQVCRRPAAARWKRKWLRDRGIH